MEDLEQEKVLCTGTFQGFLLAFKNTFFEKLPKADSIRFSCAFLSCMCRKKLDLMLQTIFSYHNHFVFRCNVSKDIVNK